MINNNEGPSAVRSQVQNRHFLFFEIQVLIITHRLSVYNTWLIIIVYIGFMSSICMDSKGAKIRLSVLRVQVHHY